MFCAIFCTVINGVEAACNPAFLHFLFFSFKRKHLLYLAQIFSCCRRSTSNFRLIMLVAAGGALTCALSWSSLCTEEKWWDNFSKVMTAIFRRQWSLFGVKLPEQEIIKFTCLSWLWWIKLLKHELQQIKAKMLQAKVLFWNFFLIYGGLIWEVEFLPLPWPLFQQWLFLWIIHSEGL